MQGLEEELNSLELFAVSLTDHDEILDCFYRYIHYFGELHIKGTMEQFSRRADISLEIGEEGVYEGRDAIQKHFEYMPKLAKKPGVLIYHYVDTPVVEIAKDGKTAKITCLAPGFDAAAKALEQNWIYGKYYVDLVKEEGEWKLWHVQWFRTFECPMTAGWLKEQTAHDREVGDPELEDAYQDSLTAKSGSYPKDWKYPKHYDPEKINYLMPEPPEPYDTWDEKTSMKVTRKY